MATAALASKTKIKDIVFEWEGKDKNGKVVRGEMRAGGEAMVSASMRRQGVLVTRVRVEGDAVTVVRGAEADVAEAFKLAAGS